MPTTPNPTGGYFLMLPRTQVRELDMTVDEALKYIISMGVVAPRLHPYPARGGGASRLQRTVVRRASRIRNPKLTGSGAGLPAAGNGPALVVPFDQPCRRSVLKRTDYCGRIDRRYLDQTVTVMGWVHRRRDHGGVIFIDLRDREGLVQVVCDPDRGDDVRRPPKQLRSEFCIAVTGRVRPRPEGTVNPNLVSGEIEVLAHDDRDPQRVADAAVPARRREPLRDRAPRASRARPAPSADAEAT